MKPSLRSPVLAPAALALSVLLAATAAQAGPEREALRAAYADAREGRASPEAVLKQAEAALASAPGDPVAIAYCGSLKAMIARDAFLPTTKLRMVAQAVDLLDDAVSRLDRAGELAGHDARLDVLMVAATTNARLPRTFGRRPAAERDFRAVLALPTFPQLEPAQRATVHAWLAVLSADQAEAERLLAQARADDAATADAIWADR